MVMAIIVLLERRVRREIEKKKTNEKKHTQIQSKQANMYIPLHTGNRLAAAKMHLRHK